MPMVEIPNTNWKIMSIYRLRERYGVGKVWYGCALFGSAILFTLGLTESLGPAKEPSSQCPYFFLISILFPFHTFPTYFFYLRRYSSKLEINMKFENSKVTTNLRS